MAQQGLIVRIGANLDEFNRAMATVEGKLRDFGSKVEGIGRTMAIGVTVPIGTAGAAAIKFASDYEESLNKVDVAFGDSAGVIKSWANTTLENFGIARGTALDMAALYGDMATSMGLPSGAAADMSTELVGLAGDLASFKNIQIDVANNALKSVFTGETESLKMLGVVMTDANLQQFAYEQGIRKTTQSMTQQEKVMLRYQYVLANTGNAQGDFARTNDGAANQMRIFQEQLKEVGQELGTYILPLFTDAIKRLNDFIKEFRDQPDIVKQRFIALSAAVAGVGPVLYTLGKTVRGFAKVMSLLRSKVLIIVVAFAAVMVIIDYLIQQLPELERRFERTVTNMVVTASNFASRVASGLGAGFMAMGAIISNMGDETAGAGSDFQTFGEYAEDLKGRLEPLKDLMDELIQKFLGWEIPDEEESEGKGTNKLEPPSITKWEKFWTGFKQLFDINQKAVEKFVESFATGLSELVIYGGKLKDYLRDIAKQLAAKGIQKLIEALIFGGGSFIKNGGGDAIKGLFGKLFQNLGGPIGKVLNLLLSGIAQSGAPVLNTGMVDQYGIGAGMSVNIAGEFVLDGQDLRLVVDRANQVLR